MPPSFEAAIAPTPASGASFGIGMTGRAFGDGSLVSGSIAVSSNQGGATLTVAVADTVYRTGLTTVTMGALPTGWTDNNDGSFTNDTGATQYVRGMITIQGIFSPQRASTQFVAGTDESGSDAQILSGSGGWQGCEASGYISWTVFYDIALSNGKSVFPMYRNKINTDPFLVSSQKHIIWSNSVE